MGIYDAKQSRSCVCLMHTPIVVAASSREPRFLLPLLFAIDYRFKQVISDVKTLPFLPSPPISIHSRFLAQSSSASTAATHLTPTSINDNKITTKPQSNTIRSIGDDVWRSVFVGDIPSNVMRLARVCRSWSLIVRGDRLWGMWWHALTGTSQLNKKKDQT
jgi:hypothetical protein